MFANIAGLFFNPRAAWTRLSTQSDEQLKRQLWYPIVLPLIPAVAFWYGTTSVGWKVFGDEIRRLTPESAVPLAVLFYLVLIGAVVFLGWMVHTMAATYHTRSSTARGIMLMGYACSPVFIVGVFGVYPVWWLDVLLATVMCSYAIYNVYLGVPELLHVPEDRGFLFASAVFMVALVYVVAAMVVTILLWEYIATPVFTG